MVDSSQFEGRPCPVKACMDEEGKNGVPASQDGGTGDETCLP